MAEPLLLSKKETDELTGFLNSFVEASSGSTGTGSDSGSSLVANSLHPPSVQLGVDRSYGNAGSSRGLLRGDPNPHRGSSSHDFDPHRQDNQFTSNGWQRDEHGRDLGSGSEAPISTAAASASDYTSLLDLAGGNAVHLPSLNPRLDRSRDLLAKRTSQEDYDGSASRKRPTTAAATTKVRRSSAKGTSETASQAPAHLKVSDLSSGETGILQTQADSSVAPSGRPVNQKLVGGSVRPAASLAGKTTKPKGVLLTSEEKKANHIASEQKRRSNIRLGFERLCEIVPCEEEGTSTTSTPLAPAKSESVILLKTVEHVRTKLKEKRALLARLRALRRASTVQGGDAIDCVDEGADSDLDTGVDLSQGRSDTQMATDAIEAD